MFRDLPRYEAYHRPIEWLDSIPAHWSRRRFGTLLREKDIRSLAGEEQLLRVSQYTGVTERRAESGEGIDSRSDSLVGYKRVKQGQLAVNIMLAWNGSLGVSPYDGIVSPAYCVYSFKANLDPWFFHYLLRSPQLKARIKVNSRGIVDSRLRLYSDDLYRLEAGVPPLEEQAAIVKYLAHANARIDKAIAAKRRLIVLLEEQRDATVKAILSTSSDPKAPSKLVATGRLCRIETGVEDSGNADPDGDYPFFVRGREILRASDYHFDTEAVLTPGDGQGGTGKVFHYYNGKFQAHQRVYVFSQFSGIIARYFYWYMTAFFREHALAQSNTVTMESLRRPVLASFRVAVPDENAQRALVERIEAQVIDTAQVVEKTQREIALLREFRTRLVADVVTGQVDVRAIAASLPDTPEQDTALDSLLDDDLEDVLGEGEE